MTNKLKQFAIGVSTLSLWALSTPAFAQDFPTQKVLPLELSTQAAMAAIKNAMTMASKSAWPLLTNPDYSKCN